MVKKQTRFVGQRKVRFKFPGAVESVLVFLLAIFLFGLDVSQNKFIDFGIARQCNIIGGITVLCVNAFILFFILYHITLGLLAVRAIIIRKDKTFDGFDVAAFFFATLGMFFIIAGAIAGIEFGAREAVPYLLGFAQIDVYHVGILLQLIVGLYYAATE